MIDARPSAVISARNAEQPGLNEGLNSTFDGFPEQINPTKHLNLTSFFVASNIVVAIMSVAGFALNAVFMLKFFLAFYGVAAILGVVDFCLKKEEQSFSSFIDAMAKRTLPIVAIAFTFKLFFHFYISSALFYILMASSALFSCQALMKAVKPGMSWRDRIINLLPVLLLAMSLSVIFNVHGIADFISFPYVIGFAHCSFFMFLGYYELKDNKIAGGTFNLDAWPKCLMFFSIEFIVICAAVLDPAVITVLTSIPIAEYLAYMVFMIPMIFNYVFAVEFVFRSSILYFKEQLGDSDPHNILFGILCVLSTCLYILSYYPYYPQSFMGFMLCVAIHLPQSWGLIRHSIITEGIELSVSLVFALNLVILLLFPFDVSNISAVTVTWPFVLILLFKKCVNEIKTCALLMFCDKHFGPEVSDDMLGPAVAKHGSGLEPGQENDARINELGSFVVVNA